jgi:RNA polymerase sigma-70 factor, ECF subfamily
MHRKERATATIYHTEEELVAAAKSGRQDAFAQIVEQHSGTVYNLALRLMKDPHEAEEVLQETFISAFRALAKFEGRSQLSTWLYRIGYNAALMRLRKRQTPTESLDEPLITESGEQLPRELVDWGSIPDDLLLNAELRTVLNAALDTLPESLRSIFVLRDIEGLSTAEAAEALGLTETNAKVRLHRARLALRERLTEYFAGARWREKEGGKRGM